MNFQESIDYLYGLGYELSVKKFGLENTFTLLKALGNPEKNFLKIQIAGTNGKGSTCAFLESILIQANISVGKYTSPHLISITERICVDGEEISEEKFAEYATKIKAVSEKLVADGNLQTVPTFFEQVTAIALNYFADNEIEIAILETGLGGRFDSTTAARAEIVAFTPIDLDHQNILGNTIEEISSEKAAIIRNDSIVVIGRQKSESLKVILERCQKKNVAPVLNNCRLVEENQNEYFFLTKECSYFVDSLGLIGEHQFQNACLAIDIAEILKADFKFEISNSEIEKGLTSAKHYGRMEWSEYKNIRILFDGAHNSSGATALKNYLKKYHGSSQITMIFGSMKDKDLNEISENLFSLAENLILTKPDNPRSETPENLKIYAEKVLEDSKLFLIPSVCEAIWTAIEFTKNYSATKPAFVCVTGSLYLIGEIQKILQDKSEI